MLLKTREEIIESCRFLRFKGIQSHFEEELETASDYEDYLARLPRHEIAEKEKRSIELAGEEARTHENYKEWQDAKEGKRV